jgi:uncharacterized membrane protein YczE
MFSTLPRDVTLRRLPRLGIGLLVFGAGIGLMVRADLGLPPWDVLHQGIAMRTPLSMGLATVATSFAVLLLWIPLRERPGIGTLANAVVIGLAVDLTLFLVGPAPGLMARWTRLLGGLLLVGIGSGAYIGVRLGPGPRDGLMTGIARRGPSIRLARTGVEGSALLIGWLLGGTVGIGTLVFAVAIGPLVQVALARLDLGPA